MIAGLLATLVTLPSPARGAPCVTACKDEIAACVATTCPGLTGGAKRRCKRRECSKPIVKDCYHDLTVCGATRAHPAPPSTPPRPTPPSGW